MNFTSIEFLVPLGMYVVGIVIGYLWRMTTTPSKSSQKCTAVGRNNVVVQSGQDTYVNGEKYVGK